jgi:glycosyltransferase involved in cell wall biosynthesis
MAPPGFHPIRGGTETMVQNLSLALKGIGVSVDVMTFNMPRKWEPKWSGEMDTVNGLKVFRIPALNWMPTTHSMKITNGVNLIPGRFTHLMKEYDIIHFHELEFSFPLFSRLVRKPKIFHLHGFSVDFLRRYHLTRAILKHVSDYYISIHRKMQRDLVGLGIAKDRIMYLPNAVDVELFHPGGEKEDNVLLYLGRITPMKGLHVLLQSLSYLEEPIRLLIAGPADWSHSYYQNMLKEIDVQNSTGKHEVLYLGVVSQADLLELYRRASIYILPSFGEAFPVTILEALASGTPVITTPVGGIPEIITPFENGILVPRNDPVKLAGAISNLLANSKLRRQLSAAGRDFVVSNFSVNAIAGRLRRIYERILA